MIAKGTTHNSGVRLAHYLITGKEGEKAKLGELRGFAEDDVVEAFRSIHVLADATKCQKPFYHVQVRTPDGEELTREQWLHVADRIEARLGLADQPRAVAFHERDGHVHMHVAWSRIDEETLTAKELNFDHRHLVEVSRELEIELGLTRVPSVRARAGIAPPSRPEMEQDRRLETDWRAVRAAIREAWEASENGRDLIDNLDARELLLARGDRRNFVVIDPHGGVHALGRRLTGASAAETRMHLADLDSQALLSVTEAQHALRESRSERYLARPRPEAKLDLGRTGRTDEPRPDVSRQAPDPARPVVGVASLALEGVASAGEKAIDLLGSLFDGASALAPQPAALEELPMNKPAAEPREIQAAIVRTAHRETGPTDVTVAASFASNPAAATPDLEQQIRNQWRRQQEQAQERER